MEKWTGSTSVREQAPLSCRPECTAPRYINDVTAAEIYESRVCEDIRHPSLPPFALPPAAHVARLPRSTCKPSTRRACISEDTLLRRRRMHTGRESCSKLVLSLTNDARRRDPRPQTLRIPLDTRESFERRFFGKMKAESLRSGDSRGA